MRAPPSGPAEPHGPGLAVAGTMWTWNGGIEVGPARTAVTYHCGARYRNTNDVTGCPS